MPSKVLACSRPQCEVLPLLVLVLVLRLLLLLTCVDFPKSPLPVRWNDRELSTLFKVLHSFALWGLREREGGSRVGNVTQRVSLLKDTCTLARTSASAELACAWS